MAVPKKRTSKSKKNSSKSKLEKKRIQSCSKITILAKSMLKGKTTSFIYSIYIDMMNKSLNLFKDLFTNL